MVRWLVCAKQARTKVRYSKKWNSGLSARGGQVARAKSNGKWRMVIEIRNEN